MVASLLLPASHIVKVCNCFTSIKPFLSDFEFLGFSHFCTHCIVQISAQEGQAEAHSFFTQELGQLLKEN